MIELFENNDIKGIVNLWKLELKLILKEFYTENLKRKIFLNNEKNIK